MDDFTPSPERGRIAFRDPDLYHREYCRDVRALRADRRAYLASDLYRHDLFERVREAIEAARNDNREQ